MPPSSAPAPAPPATDPSLDALKLRLLKLLLLLGIAIVLIIWYSESASARIRYVDSIAYPLMLLSFSGCLVVVHFRPAARPLVELAGFCTLGLYDVANLEVMLFRLEPGLNTYDVATFTQWFPLLYTGAFVFFARPTAIAYSLFVYLSLLLPTLFIVLTQPVQTWDNETLPILFTMNLSHPLLVTSLFIITQLREQLARARTRADEMSIAASVDMLTGIANRRSIDAALQRALSLAQTRGEALSLILLDIDHFKPVNDTFGHAVGDTVLTEVVAQLRAQLRATDALGRWGGEEFLVIVTGAKAGPASQLAERIRAAVECQPHPHDIHITLSLGVAEAILADRPETLVKRADDAMYRAKRHGRNRVEIADSAAPVYLRE